MRKILALVLTFISLQSLGALTQASLPPEPQGRSGAIADEGEKSLANGLTISGGFAAVWASGSVAITVGRVENSSFSRTTGTLRLELWATTTRPARGVGFTGYKLAVTSTLAPLPPRSFYSDVVRTTAFTSPPDGTYWLVLVLAEFDSVNCPSGDRYCIEDSMISDTQETFGFTPPPPPPRTFALENPQPSSYQSGIGLISGWACSGNLTATIGSFTVPVAYGTPRQDVTSICGASNVNTGFGVLFNYNALGSGVHTARVFRNGVELGSATFTVSAPGGEFMTGVTKEVTVPNFPTFGRTATLIWQQSQQNFAIKSVVP